LHGPARNARIVLDNAREATAEALGVRPDEVTFTPSGTHAVHLGVLGLLAGQARSGSTLAASAVEHASVMHAGRWHAERGGTFRTLAVDGLGRLTEPPPAGTTVLALQTANHEVGTVQPVDATTGAHALFTDACASGGRAPLPQSWDAAALSAHKWGGPAGVGVLVVRKGARWRNPFPGDDRVEERATGMEDVAGALASAAALQAVVAERDETDVRQRALVDRLRAGVAAIPDTDVVGDPVDRLPHLVTFSFLYVDGEAIVTELDRRGFAVASGSACTASALEPSHVLAAMGALTHGNVRVSVGRDTTEADIDLLLAALPEVVARIREDAGL
jgi:cysteine desulfurase